MTTLAWSPSAVKPLGVAAAAVGLTGSYILDWGDGSRSDAAGAAAATHVYAAAGAYTISAVQADTVVATAQVFVRDGLAPQVTFVPGADNPNIIDATFGDDPAGLISKYRVNWGDGSAVQEIVAPKGHKTSHGFPAGNYAVRVTDTQTKRTLVQGIEVHDKTYDPDFDLTKGADNMTADVTLTVAAGTKDVLVDWGHDGVQTTIPNGAVGAKVSHTYTEAVETIIQVVYADGSTEGSALPVTIPWPAAEAASAPATGPAGADA